MNAQLRLTEVLKKSVIYNKYYYSHQKTWENENVYSLILKHDRVVVILMSCGRLSHNFGAAKYITV